MRDVIGPLLRILVVGLVLLVGAILLVPRPGTPPPAQATEYPEPLSVPTIELIDDSGKPFRTAELEGQFTLLFFGFTHCPDICPLSLQVLAVAVDRLRASRPRAVPDVVLVSVDPQRDSPDRLRQYLDNFDPSFRGVTGEAEALQPLLGAFGITVMRQPLAGDNYNMTHNPQVFVIGPEAQLIAILSRAEDPEIVAQDFLRIRERHLSGSAGTRRAR
jgi:protein SCO1/2